MDNLPQEAGFVDNGDGTGDFTWDTDFDDVGVYQPVFTVSDGDLTGDITVTITISNVNRAPSIADLNQGNQIAADEDAIVSFQLTGSDPDGDALEYEWDMDNLPQEAGFIDNGDGTGDFTWDTDFDDVGVYQPVFTVSDGDLTGDITVTITISNVNRAPSIADLNEGNQIEGAEDALVAFRLEATDPDGDALEFNWDMDNLPQEAGFVDNGDGTGDFTWDTGFDDEGVYQPVFTVTDGDLTGEIMVTITIGEVNRPPFIINLNQGNQVEANEDDFVEFRLEATDPDGDALEFNWDMDNLHQAANFDDNGDGTGDFTWDTGFDDEGVYRPVFTVSDGDLTGDITVTITISNVNRAPSIADLNEGNQIAADEDEIVAFRLEATDPDGDALEFNWDMDNLPQEVNFVDNGNGAGVFVWDTDFDDEGVYQPVFTISDGDLTDDITVTITISNVNRAPSIADLNEGNQIEGAEDAIVAFRLEATDPDGDALEFNWDMDNLPQEAGFVDNGDGTGDFTWDTDFDDEGVYQPVFTVSDGDLAGDITVTITISHVNRQPEWVDIPEMIEVQEGDPIQFDFVGRDPDDHRLAISFASPNLPRNVEIRDHGDGSGSFAWQTDYESAGNYQAVFTLSDGELETVAVVEINVGNVNRAPSIADLNEGNQIEGAEDALVAFRLEATDPDGDALEYNWDMDNLPQAAGFVDNGDGTGDFTWNTGFDDEGVYQPVFTVSDGDLTGEIMVTITIGEVNRPPFISNLNQGNQVEANENELVEFTLEASDPDGDALEFNWDMDNLPQVASFVDNGDGTGDFTWDTGFDDEGVYQPVFTVSDGDLTGDITVTITVTGVNRAPSIADLNEGNEVETNEDDFVVFRLDASDPDGDVLEFDWDMDNLPQEAGFVDNGDGTGIFAWDTDYDDEGVYQPIFTVSDGDLTGDITVMITISNVNRAPSIADLNEGNQIEGAEDALVAFRLEATDPDGDALEFNWDMDNLPQAAGFVDNGDGTGDFTWDTGFDDEGVYRPVFTVTDGDLTGEIMVTITIGEVNRPPFIINLNQGNQVEANENELVEFRLEATDPDGDALEFNWDMDNLPQEAGFVDNGDGTGDFTWDTDYDDEGVYQPVFTVSDGDLSGDITVTITISHVNRQPEWVDVPEMIDVQEGDLIQFGLIGRDPDNDQLVITFDSPNIHDNYDFEYFGDGSGSFEWQTDYESAGNYQAEFTLTDGELETVAVVEINVGNVNRAPSIADLNEGNQVEGAEDALVAFRLEATDPDGDALEYNWDMDNLPQAAGFVDNGDGTGDFTWNTGFDDEGVYQPVFTVSDGDLTGEILVTITIGEVNRPPFIINLNQGNQVEANENEIVEFTLEASDPDGDALEFNWDMDNLPQEAGFVDNGDGTGDFTWDTGFDDEGVYRPVFTVSDGDLTGDIAVTITISNVNRAPSIADLNEGNEVEANEDDFVVFRLDASDPDGDALEFDWDMDNLPQEAGFVDNGNGTAIFAWDTDFDDEGVYQPVFTVSDGDLAGDITVTITITGVNRAPSIADLNEGNQVEANEDDFVVFRLDASDPDGDALEFDWDMDNLPQEAGFVDNGNGTGIFAWDTDFDDEGVYQPVFTVSDGDLTGDITVTITISNVNRAPEWVEIPDRIDIQEGELVQFEVRGFDPDNDELRIAYQSDNLPENVDFVDNGDGTALFRWQTDQESAGNYQAEFTLSDGDLERHAVVEINVEDVNRAPVWVDFPDDIEVEEGQIVQFAVTGRDPDNDQLRINYFSDNLPDVVDFVDNGDGSGVFNWQIDYESVGRYQAEFTLSDGDLETRAVVEINVRNVNRAPSIADLNEGNQIEAAEGALVAFRLEAADPDGDALEFDWDMDNLPQEAGFVDNGDGTGDFNWDTGFDDEGVYQPVFTVSDGDLTGEIVVTITIGEVNRAPWISDLNDRNQVEAAEDEIVLFRLEATDPDGDALEIDWDMVNLPQEANFVDNGDGTGIFIWDTGFEDEGVYQPVFTVSDGNLTDEIVVTITITDVNRPPIIADLNEGNQFEAAEDAVVAFRLEANDSDGDALEFNWDMDNLPQEAEFADNGDGTGVFIWDTGFDDEGVYQPVFTVSDGELTDEMTVTITITNVNRAPSIVDLNEGNQIDGAENAIVVFRLEATDPDGDALEFDWDMENLPQEARFVDNGNGTGDFIWNTDFDDSGVYQPVFTVSDGDLTGEIVVTITISDVNRPPVITEPTDEQMYQVRVDEGQEVEIEFAANDPDDNVLSWAIQGQGNLPDEWSFTDNEDGSAVFGFNPMYEAAGVYALTFIVSDPEEESDQVLVIVTVSDVNRPPVVVEEIEDVTFNEDSGMFMVGDLDNTFNDPDGDELSYSVEVDEPLMFMVIGGVNLLTLNSPANFNGDNLEVTVTADDGREGSIEISFLVTVAPVNDAPFWAEVPDDIEDEAGAMILFDLIAGDIDLEFEGDQLTLSLHEDDGTLDRGAAFFDNEDNSGSFGWRTVNEDAGEYTLTFMVEDEAGASETVDVTIVLLGDDERELTVMLDEGWNMISINVIPSQEMYRENEDRGPDIILMTEHLRIDQQNHHVEIMKDGDGRFYIPAFRFSNIPYWDLPSGYQMKLDEDIESVWSGMPIAADADIPMSTGWNMIAYFPQYELDAGAPNFYVLSPIRDILETAKDNDGNFMIPAFWFSNMPPWRETQGYKVKLTEDVVFNYPPEEEEEVLLVGTEKEPNHIYTAPVHTGQNMSLLVNSIQGARIDDYNQLVALDSGGNVVGVATFEIDRRCGIAIWGNDATTEIKDGLLEREGFELRLVDNETGADSNLIVSSVVFGNGLLYMPDGLTVLDVYVAESVPEEYYLGSNFPNPFNSTTKIKFGIPEDSNVNISVYDLSGRLIMNLMNSEMNAGHHQIVWNADGLPTGLYMVKIHAGVFTAQQKAILVK